MQPMQFLQQHPGRQDVVRGGTSIDQQLLHSSQPVPPGEPLDDSPLPNCSIWNTVLTDRDKQLLSEPRRASAMALPRRVVLSIRHGLGRKSRGSHERSPVLALPCRCRCRLLLAEISKGVDRNSELKQRLQLWQSGQINALISLVPGSAELRAAAQNNREDAAADRRTAREASMCFDSPRIHQQSHEGTGWWRRAGALQTAAGTGPQPSFHGARALDLIPPAWSVLRRRGRYKLARRAMREQGRSKTGIASLPHVKLSPMSAPHLLANGWNTWMPLSLSQELARGDVCFGSLRLVGGVPLLAQYAVDVLEEGEGPDFEQFDGDELIRSHLAIRAIMEGQILENWRCSDAFVSSLELELCAVAQKCVLFDQNHGFPRGSNVGRTPSRPLDL